MSVPVDLSSVKAQSEQFGALAYLVTVNDDGRPHVVSAAIVWDGDAIVAGAGRRTGGNVTERRAVTILWPPYEDGGFSLLVDGSGSVDGDDARIEPEKAILHRAATND